MDANRSRMILHSLLTLERPAALSARQQTIAFTVHRESGDHLPRCELWIGEVTSTAGWRRIDTEGTPAIPEVSPSGQLVAYAAVHPDEETFGVYKHPWDGSESTLISTLHGHPCALRWSDAEDSLLALTEDSCPGL